MRNKRKGYQPTQISRIVNSLSWVAADALFIVVVIGCVLMIGGLL